MKKAMIFGIGAVLVTGIAHAQDGMVMVGQGGSDASEVQVTAEAALVSSHVWRGQVLNNDFVIQPQLTVEQYGVSLNLWGNYDLGNNWLGVSSDFSEFNLSLAYTLPLDINDIAIDLGIIGYHYPANGSGVGPVGINKQSTTELFAKATVLSIKDYVIPSVTFFGDIDEANGVYILFDVVAPYQISDYLWVEGGVSAGWGNTSYNDYYWFGAHDSGWNDYNFYGNVSYEIMENVTAAVNLTYTLLEGGSISTNPYEANEKFYGGVNIAYDF
jgi:outer membrane scaffolding protein for murein synthesis (MipA/OmpV family)